MRIQTNEKEVLSKIVRWAGEENLVRVVVLESSRANPEAPLDILSDYDLALYVSDTRPFVRNDAWLQAYGRPLLTVRDAQRVFGLRQYNCMVLYDDGTKIDYSILPVALLRRMREKGRLTDNLDLGYRVLFDKDGLTRELPPPSYTAHIPRKPTEQEFRSLIEEFWFCTTYVAKYLWRDEFFPVKVILDHETKWLLLRRMLEWRIEIDHDWSLKPGFFGKGLEKYVDVETWAQLEATYVGPDREDNWTALLKTTDLFRRIAVDVARGLGYGYPHHIDEQMTLYLQQIRQLAPQTNR
jgi:aminoglycoside 6-adenylyltransferase